MILPDKDIQSIVAALPANRAAIESLRANGMNDIADELEKTMRKAADKTSVFLDQFITDHPKLKEMKDKARKLALVDDPVLIQGPTGTGKELIAQALHGQRVGRFIAINCAGLPEHLIESELFGHIKGAFTDATKDKTGLFVEAKDGTLFLDEVGELKPDLQAKLLRALQSKEVRPVGSNKTDPINCRFVSATHHDLASILNKGFREDLYWRISTFILETLPLEHRYMDIELIVEELDDEKKINIKEFCSRIKPSMLPGNVRQLQQMVRRFYVLGEMP